MVYCLGTFQVYRGDELIENWNGRKSALVFKYLVLHREQSVRRESLMEQFWPDTDEESQRNSLNVAIYGLRQALRNGDPDFSSVMFSQGCYGFSPDVHLWVDYEAFQTHFHEGKKLDQQGQTQAAIQEYLKAEMLYQGTFLTEDLYEDWLTFQRQNLQDNYLSVLHSLSGYYYDRQDFAACVTTCNKMLEVDPCLEEAHQQLMRCYYAQGQVFLVQRQYYLCSKTLQTELQINPAPETTGLYHQLRAE
jgi:DNA-binding SARP family transcriptional activator